MGKWIKYIAGILTVVFLLWYLSAHRDKLTPLLKIDSVSLLWIFFVTLIASFNGSFIMQRLLSLLKIKASFGDMFMLQNAGYLLNYLPMKFGTFFRAAYLKYHYGLLYAHFGVFFSYLGLLMALSVSFVGLIVLTFVYGLSDYYTKILAFIFMCVFVVSFILALVPLPVPKGNNKFSETVRNLLNGRKEVIGEKKKLLVCTLLFVLNYIPASIRLGIIYHSMGQDITPAGCLVLGSLAYTIMFVNITPGSLGLRELILGSAAMAVGVPFEVGAFAAIIDRAIAIGWAFLVGGICTACLWYKYPEDFKKVEAQNA